MKTQIFKISIVCAAATVGIFSCKRDKMGAAVSQELVPKQDVFAVDYNATTSNKITQSVFNLSNIDNDKAALGRALFYDPRLSISGTVACANCHKQELAFSDDVSFSMGFKGLGTSLNALPLSTLENDNILFWENRAQTLEQLSLMPVANHLEMGFLDIQDVVARLNQVDFYNTNFTRVFGNRPDETTISSALSEFMRSLRSVNSKYDQGFESNARQNFANFTMLENTGKDLFFNKYNCGSCHGVQSELEQGWSEVFTNIGLDAPDNDDPNKFVGFKVPSLRNIALTAPYMHDGRFQTLSEVIDHYSEGIKMNPSLNWLLRDTDSTSNVSIPKKFNITPAEKEAIIAFMNTLTDHAYIRDRRFSNPFMP
ncbi:MAG: c-type cytochrome [Bacteroidia bacterium]|nr:c-type cytochrome [Bacteroidia bacterium]